MTDSRGRGLLPESHLLPDAVVAFVDGELSLGAQDRAASHIARCPLCAGDVAAQRQARAAVHDAPAVPGMSAGFLASLRAIPDHTDLPVTPDNLAVTEDGQLVAIQRPERVAGLRGMPAGLGSSAPLGSGTPLGGGSAVLNSHRSASVRKRAAQGAGVVVSGIVLSALALVATSSGGSTAQTNPEPSGGTPPGVLRAQFGGQQAAPTTTTTAPVATPVVENH
ncbi:zf-HC2 domain-containing protein [Amycolatopsis acidicola]|uniref:Zf-HC2 domain-containing protein n=1 Tax=Amycolatopsis acidicola TaxID=2596893 RepID=A0A5N0V0H4_9PSEU|nr:zf-HC2 domain-containing protein [Amycolatopsis acidicola]KAA9158865.1 zf-HC2 domain-containing protein [Amycolatopsis acidicola]